MWAQDVGAMLGYHSGATTAMSSLGAFSVPTFGLDGLNAAVTSAETAALEEVAPIEATFTSAAAGIASGVASGASSAASLASSLPLSSLTSVAQIAMYPASMLISPMMSLAQMGNQSAAAASAAGASLVDAPKMVGAAAGDLAKPLGGLGGVGGGGMAGGLGGAHLVGAMSVPPTWQGSMPTKLASSAMSGLGPGGLPSAALAGAPAGGGMPMMPMPMGMGGGGGMPGGPLGRGGASPHVTQNRPSVVPRTGVG
jgi:PPE-repeat protein